MLHQRRSPRAGLLLAIIASIGASCGRQEPEHVSAPVELLDLPELKARIAALQGKPLLINHWATW